MIKVQARVVSSNVAVDQPPRIAIGHLLKNRLAKKAPRLVGFAINKFIEDSGYANVTDGIRQHKGMYYIPWVYPNEYSPPGISQVTVKRIKANIVFDPRFLNQSFGVNLNVGEDLGHLAVRTNVTIPVRVDASCRVKVSAGILSQTADGLLTFEASADASAMFRLWNMTIRSSNLGPLGKKRVSFSSPYNAPTRVSVDTDTIVLTSADFGSVGCLLFGFNICDITEALITNELFGVGDEYSLDAILNQLIAKEIEKELGNAIGFDIFDPRIIFFCDFMSCNKHRNLPSLTDHVSVKVSIITRKLLWYVGWIVVQVSIGAMLCLSRWKYWVKCSCVIGMYLKRHVLGYNLERKNVDVINGDAVTEVELQGFVEGQVENSPGQNSFLRRPSMVSASGNSYEAPGRSIPANDDHVISGEVNVIGMTQPDIRRSRSLLEQRTFRLSCTDKSSNFTQRTSVVAATLPGQPVKPGSFKTEAEL